MSIPLCPVTGETSEGVIVHYEADSSNLLYGITSDDRLAVYPPEKFKTISPDPDKTEEVGMTTTPLEEIRSEGELRRLLYLPHQ